MKRPNCLISSSIACLLAVAITGVVFLSSCASGPMSGEKGLTNIRAKALKDTATTYGAQYGLALQGEIINRSLGHHQKSLDQIYNFNRMLLPHNVLPPVLMEGRNSLHIASRDTLRLADRLYTIVKPATFVTAAPTWRDYLYLNFNKPDAPHFTLRPHTREERAVWDEALVEGFKSGIRQATLIFKTNVSLLNRDFEGMVRYQVLLAKHMVTPPYVASTAPTITGDKQHLRIGDKILRITADSGLVTESSVWRPALIEHKEQPEAANDCNLLTTEAKRQACHKNRLKQLYQK